MLTAEESGFPFPFSAEIGYRRDFKGLGVFLYKELNRNGKWVSSYQTINYFYVAHHRGSK
jgi:hypothetical protein